MNWLFNIYHSVIFICIVLATVYTLLTYYRRRPSNGADGKDGKDGLDGKDGKDGIDGTNGTNGRIKDQVSRLFVSRAMFT